MTAMVHHTDKPTQVYFWATIRKLKAKYYPCRGVQEETVCAILRESVIWEKDAQAAHKQLLELSGVAKYYRGLKSEDEKEHFERHLRKYINIYLPDCPFEVATTNRYTITTAEACVKARRTIKRGEMVKYLTGIQVEMTEKEEEELSSRTDFSIVLSSRRKRPSLFLGPARFANHDCDSNARLNTSGPHGIHIVAVKEILPGDEITVTYGDDYFGIDNCECLCATCESMQRNGWDPKGPWLKDDSSDEESEAEEDETDSENIRPQTRVRHQSPRSESAVLGKRKRGDDTPASGRNDQLPPAKKRGRPPKQRQSNEEEQSGHGLKTTSEKRKSFLNHLSQTERDGAGRSDSGLGLFSKVKSHSPDFALEKIYKLLSSVADRSMAQAGEKASVSSQSRAGAANETDLDDGLSTPVAVADVTHHERSAPLSRRNATAVGTGLLTPPYARGLSRSPDPPSGKQRGPPPPTPNSMAGSSKLRVPTIKKERSISSLRNVVNATPDEGPADIFSIPASPGPGTAEPPKRKRGRPRKNARPDESEDSTDSSISSASNNGDSVSSASTQASSATSMDTFAAGNIAHSICQMLVTDAEAANAEAEVDVDVHVKEEEAEEEEEPIELVAPVPRKTRRQAQAEAAAAEEAARVQKEAAKLERRRGRGPLRKSPRKAPPSTSRPPIQSIETPDPSTQADDEGDKVEEGYHRGPVRKPQDYHLTPQLLATPYHRWVECRNCDDFFVQSEAYLTRIACPRCERHSKLYGYYWPKTDKEGKWDGEERVRDHRTIHRFIDAEDERAERKGRRTLADVVREREESGRVGSESSLEEPGGKRLRGSPGGRRRGRQTM